MAIMPSSQRSQPVPEQPLPTAAPLPPAQTFDVLPALHELLARIEHTSLPPGDTGEESIDHHYTDLAPLEPKDLPAEVLSIKSRIRRALRELEKLPDMHRSVAEQEQEIAALESRVQVQRAMIRRLGELAGEAHPS